MTKDFDTDIGLTRRLLDRTFDACRIILRIPYDEHLAVEEVARYAHLDAATTRECMLRLAGECSLRYSNGRVVFNRRHCLV